MGKQSPDEARKAEARRRLRAALDGIELLPEETSDDRRIRVSEAQRRAEESERDAEFERNRPPHHGS